MSNSVPSSPSSSSSMASHAAIMQSFSCTSPSTDSLESTSHFVPVPSTSPRPIETFTHSLTRPLQFQKGPFLNLSHYLLFPSPLNFDQHLLQPKSWYIGRKGRSMKLSTYSKMAISRTLRKKKMELEMELIKQQIKLMQAQTAYYVNLANSTSNPI
ncbi:hypothetical protein TCAL_16313, partial [Tigriopus californicus]